MENEYSKVYNYFFNKTFKNVETIYKALLIKNKEQGRSFTAFQNKSTTKIYDLSTDKFYINTSNKFNDIIKTYRNRNFIYEDELTNSIFTNELYDIFYSIKKIKKGYTFKICMTELGQINGLSEAYRRLKKSEPLIQIIYKLNDFSEFKLWSYSTSVYGSKFYEKYRVRLYPSPITEKHVINFEIKKEYEEVFKRMYLKFIKFHIDEAKTTEQDFINVFTKSTDKHDSKIHFFCRTPEVWLLIKELKFAFKKLTLKNVENSLCFFSSDGNKLTQTNLSKMSGRLKSGSLNFDEELFNEATLNVKTIKDQLKTPNFC